jgi:hypothetical protein
MAAMGDEEGVVDVFELGCDDGQCSELCVCGGRVGCELGEGKRSENEGERDD